MNLIDAYVTKVLGKKEHILTNREIYTIFEVEYQDMGGIGTTHLIYEKDKEPDVKKGFHFLH